VLFGDGFGEERGTDGGLLREGIAHEDKLKLGTRAVLDDFDTEARLILLFFPTWFS
jgi:hypothetical protein